MTSERVRQRLRIHGQVQGVWYRESMRQEAERRCVDGWVRNRTDGTVEASVQGNAEAVAALIEWARRGPEAARVGRVEVTSDADEVTGFEKRPTL